MDNLCHSLVGAALAETGLRSRTRYAPAALVLGANLPDLDVAAALTEHGLGFRRGLTHGIPAMVILPVVLAGLIVLWGRIDARRGRPADRGGREGGGSAVVPKQLLVLSALAVWTHPVLDWMNVYGMRWLMPFDGTWFYGDSLFIVDPWLWLMLGAAWIAGRRLHRRGSRSAERVARILVGAAAVYVAAMAGLTAWGRSVAAAELGLADPGPKRLMVAPPFLRSWRRNVTVDAGSSYRFTEIDWLRGPSLRPAADSLPKRLELMERLPRTVPLDDLLDWARFPFAERQDDLVHVDDARYSRGGRSFAGVVVRVRGEGD